MRFAHVVPFLFASLALAACGEKDAPPPDKLVGRPVLAAPVRYTAQSQTRDFVATIRPRVETDLGFRVAGKVVRRFVDAGKKVKAGDTLALLDETDLKLQKEQSEAEFSAARVALDQAAGDERRAQKLRKDGWTAQAALDRVRTAAEEARGRFQRATRAVELSRNSLEYATLRADADGVVTAISIEPGQVVSAGQPAVRLARAGEVEAAVALPEAWSSAAGHGDAKLFLWSNPSKIYKARLRELSPSADPSTRTFAARYAIVDADAAVALGMSATLSIAPSSATPIAAVPLSALYNQGKGPALWKVETDGRLTLTPVKVDSYDSASAMISGGVKEGDTIVLLGVQKLDAGQKVRIVNPENL